MPSLATPTPDSDLRSPNSDLRRSSARAFGGVWRLTFRRFLLPGRWLLLAAGLAVFGLLCVAASPRNARDDQYLLWIIEFYLTFFVPALSFLSAGGALRDEMKSSTVDYVLTRPIRRPAFLSFKYIAHMLCTQVDFLVSFAVVLVVGTVRGMPGLAAAVPLLLLGQVLLVAAFSALGFLGGVLTSRYVVVGIAYALVIEVGIGQIPTQLSQLSMTLQVRELLTALLFPLVGATGVPTLLGTTAMLLAFGAVALGTAGTLFARRELSGGSADA